MSSSPFYSPATEKSSLLIELEASISELTDNLERDVPQASLVAARQDLDENSPFPPNGDSSSQRSETNRRLSLGLSSDFGVSLPPTSTSQHPPSFRELEDRIDRQLSAYVPADQLDALFAEYEQELRLRGQSLQDFDDTNYTDNVPPSPLSLVRPPSPQIQPVLQQPSSVNASTSLALPSSLPVTSHQETFRHGPLPKTSEQVLERLDHGESKDTQNTPLLDAKQLQDILDQQYVHLQHLDNETQLENQGSTTTRADRPIDSHANNERERRIDIQQERDRGSIIDDESGVLSKEDLAGDYNREKISDNDLTRDKYFSSHPTRDSYDQQAPNNRQSIGIIGSESDTAVRTGGSTAPRSFSVTSITSDLSFPSETGDTDTIRTRSSHSSFEFGDPCTLSANLDSMLRELDMFAKSFAETQVVVKATDDLPLPPRYEEPQTTDHEQKETYKPKPSRIVTAPAPAMQKSSNKQIITPSSGMSEKTISLLTASPESAGPPPPLPVYVPRPFEYIRTDEPHLSDTAISISTSGSPKSMTSSSSPQLGEAKGNVRSGENTASKSTSADAPGLKKMTSRIYINDLTQFKTIPFTVETTVDSVVPMVRKRINLEESDEWTLFELVGWLGVERPLRDYERVANVVAGWGVENNFDNIAKGGEEALIIKKYGYREILTAEAAKTNLFPQLFGWLLIETKPGKWSKRFVTLRDGTLWWGKDSKGTSENILCSLDTFDVYTLTRPRKRSPSKFCFCLKSQKPIHYFENPEADYAHFVCAEHLDKMRDWVLSVRAAKSRMVLDEEERRRGNIPPNGGVRRGTEQDQRKQGELDREREREKEKEKGRERERERERDKGRDREREKETERERERERGRATDMERKREKERGRDQDGEKVADNSRRKQVQEGNGNAIRKGSKADLTFTPNPVSAPLITIDPRTEQKNARKGSKEDSPFTPNSVSAPLITLDPRIEQKHARKGSKGELNFTSNTVDPRPEQKHARKGSKGDLNFTSNTVDPRPEQKHSGKGSKGDSTGAAPLLSLDPKPEQKHTGQLLKKTSKKSSAPQPLIRFD